MLQVFVVGPPESGKSTFSNYVAELSDSLNNREYHPTKGVRILEFEKSIVQNSQRVNIDVQLWDCSGSLDLIDCWDAFSPNAEGIIYVAKPEQKGFEEELDKWNRKFNHLTPNQSCVFLNRAIGQTKKKIKLSSKSFAKIPQVQTCIDQDPELVKAEFDKLIQSAYLASLQMKNDMDISAAK